MIHPRALAVCAAKGLAGLVLGLGAIGFVVVRAFFEMRGG